MKNKHGNLRDEIYDLKQELEHFEQEKERIRTIIGKIGGVPKFRTKLMNIIFIIVLVVSAAVSVCCGEKWRLLMIELAALTLSIKIIYLIHCMMRVNHFQFWILSAIEWRVNEMMKHLREEKE